jgi:hypothetical protein
MAVHAYRAVEDMVRHSHSTGRPGPAATVFSYLNASTLSMVFDPDEGHAGIKPFKVNLAAASRIEDIDSLVHMHGDYLINKPEKTVLGDRVITRLVELHQNERLSKDWWRWNQDYIHRGRKLREDNEDQLAQIKFPMEGSLSPIFSELAAGRPGSEITIGEVYAHWGFKSAYEMAAWLGGGWLEHCALLAMQKCTQKSGLCDYGRNVEPRSSQRKFETDVLAIQGYQLYLVSCYTGTDRGRAKLKLFEASVRAQQLGGNEARVALLCAGDDLRGDNIDAELWEKFTTQSLQAELEEGWDAASKLRVFGRHDLPLLEDRFQKWFKQT